MVRVQNDEHVKLSPGNWIALLGLVATVVLALIGGVWKISSDSAALRTEVSALRGTVGKLTERVEYLERRDRQ